MQVAILAGGRGVRMGELAATRPKALVDVAGAPVIRRVMDSFRPYGHDDFIIALGHHGAQLRSHFTGTGEAKPPRLVDTGANTATAGRLRRLRQWLQHERFFLTWCDGVGDIDLDALLAFHESHGRLATLTTVQPPSRFGCLSLEGDRVVAFEEKPQHAEIWINAAYFVLEPEIFDRIDGDASSFERDVLPRLAREDQLRAYRHHGFWQCMDTPEDRRDLAAHFQTGGDRARSA
jgi:glucose-1-phosphate cytidylyltransferase